jgi:hypothetical protein
MLSIDKHVEKSALGFIHDHLKGLLVLDPSNQQPDLVVMQTLQTLFTPLESWGCGVAG